MKADSRIYEVYVAPVADSVELKMEGPLAESNPGGVTPEIPDNPA